MGVSFECLGHGTQDRIVERCKAPPSALARSCREVVGGQSGRGSGQTKARCWRSLLPAAARVARAPKKVQNLAKIESESQLQQKKIILLVSALHTCNKYDACPL